MTRVQPQYTHIVVEDDTSFSGRSSNPHLQVAHEVVDVDPAIVNHNTIADDADAAPTATTDADDDDGANGLFTSVSTLQANLETRKLRHRMSLAAAGRLLWIKRQERETTDPSPLLDDTRSDHTTNNTHINMQHKTSNEGIHCCLSLCGTLSSYLQCLLICCCTAILAGAMYFVYGSRVLSDPTTSEPVLQYFIMLPVYLIQMDWVCMYLPWIMARTFVVNKEQQQQQQRQANEGEEQEQAPSAPGDTWRQFAWSWITFSPRSMRSAIGLLIFLNLATRFIPSWIQTSWYYFGGGQSLHSYIPWTLYRDIRGTVGLVIFCAHYAIILPYIFTSKHSVSRQRASTCTNLSAPFFDRIMGTPASFFVRYSYVTLWIFQVSHILADRWYRAEWVWYHRSLVIPIMWGIQAVILIIEYIVTSSRDHLYINHPGYTFGLTLWFQYFPVVAGMFFLSSLAPAYHNTNASEVEKVGLYFAMVIILTIGQYMVRILASRAVSPRIALLFVLGCQVFEDAISDMAFLQLEPFNVTFFLIAMLHVVKTIFRDLDLIVNVILALNRLLKGMKRRIDAAFGVVSSRADATSDLLAPTHYSDKLYASDLRFLYQWHQRFDRFFLRHQNFISELSCKAVILCYLLADYLVHNYATHDSLQSWSETITFPFTDDDRWTLILEMLVLTIMLVITHFVVLRLLSYIEDQEEKSIEQILSVSSSEITSNDHRHMAGNSIDTLNATANAGPRSVELQSALQLSSAIREQIIQEQNKYFYGNENYQEENGDNISPTNGGLLSDDGKSLSTQDALRWICHDAWSSKRVRFMMVVMVYYFIYTACQDAHAAVASVYP